MNRSNFNVTIFAEEAGLGSPLFASKFLFWCWYGFWGWLIGYVLDWFLVSNQTIFDYYWGILHTYGWDDVQVCQKGAWIIPTTWWLYDNLSFYIYFIMNRALRASTFFEIDTFGAESFLYISKVCMYSRQLTQLLVLVDFASSPTIFPVSDTHPRFGYWQMTWSFHIIVRTSAWIWLKTSELKMLVYIHFVYWSFQACSIYNARELPTIFTAASYSRIPEPLHETNRLADLSIDHSHQSVGNPETCSWISLKLMVL